MSETREQEFENNQSSLYEAITSPVSHVWNQYFDYITFAAPFIFARAVIPFKAGDAMQTRLIEGVGFAAVALCVEYGVKNQQLQDYSFSVLPIVGSFLYHKDPLNYDHALNQLSISALSMSLTYHAWQTGTVTPILLPAIGYVISRLNEVPAQPAAVLAVAATVFDVFSGYNEHYASWSLAGFAVTYNVGNKFMPQYATSIALAGMAAVSGLAKFEPIVMDQFFTPGHFQASYDVVNKFIDQESFGLELQRYFISTANIQLGLGYCGNYLMLGMQEITNNLVQVGLAEGDRAKTAVFYNSVVTAGKYISMFALPYLIARIPTELLSIYNTNQVINTLEKALLEQNLLVKDKFIQVAKNNYTTQSYFKDIATIADDFRVIQSSIFGIPKIAQLSNINMPTYLGLGGIVLADMMITKLFGHLTTLKQGYEDQRTKCDSEFDRVTAYDRESAVTISQKSGLPYSLAKWEELQACKYDNLLGELLLSRMIEIGQWLYVSDILYTTIFVLVAYLGKVGSIKSNELVLYARVLEVSTEALLFKNKNLAGHTKVESAVNRLDDFAKWLESGENTIAKINVYTDYDSDVLTISNLDFTRGNHEKQSHLYVDKLELRAGNIYAVTGNNGGGKSSFTTLIKYVFDHVADHSFNVTSGTITYPGGSIMIVPQKDYMPFNISLLNLILYPQTMSNAGEIESKIIDLINRLKVFAAPVTSDALYQTKNDWAELSGGQKKKLFMIKPLLECPKVLIMDETFGPLDPDSRSILMKNIQGSCLDTSSIVLIVWHQDKNEGGTSCVRETFFDYELHVQNETLVLGKVGEECLH